MDVDDDYDSESDDGDDDFNLIQPSLFQQIKTILDQYPDDGQILKVINEKNIYLSFDWQLIVFNIIKLQQIPMMSFFGLSLL